jgi:uncharacterized membrane protein
MSDDDSEARDKWDLAENLAAIGVTGLWMGALFLGVDAWWVIMLVGYIVVVGGIDEVGDYMADREQSSESAAGVGIDDEGEDEDPLERLKRRYVDGEISEAEYERRLDTLLETDRTLDDEDVDAELNLDRE